MRSNHRKRIAGVCLAAALCGLAVWLCTPPERNLFKRAQIVEPREDFLFPAMGNSTRGARLLQVDWPYCWLEPQTLLTLHSGASILSDLHPRIVDLTSGRRLSNALFAEFPNYHSGGITVAWPPPGRITMSSGIKMSPDGAWMLGTHATNPDSIDWRWPGCVAVRADNNRKVTWRTPGDLVGSAWMRDSRHWAGIVSSQTGYAVAVFDVNDNSRSAPPSFLLRMDGHTRAMPRAAPTLAGTLPDGRLLAIDWRDTHNGQVHAARFFPDAEAEHPQNLRIPVPSEDAISLVEPVLSPAGDRLAWFVLAHLSPPGWPATRRFWSLLKVRPSTQVGLWTTTPDGGDPRAVGVYTPKGEFDYPSLLQWTPDGRSLSFRHQGALYRVPVR